MELKEWLTRRRLVEGVGDWEWGLAAPDAKRSYPSVWERLVRRLGRAWEEAPGLDLASAPWLRLGILRNSEWNL